MRLRIAQVVAQQDLDALVLKAIDGSARGLVDKTGRCRLRIYDFVCDREAVAVAVAVAVAIAIATVLAKRGKAFQATQSK